MPKKTVKKAAAKVQFIGFVQAMKNYVKRTFDFKGVSTRAEYWWPFLSVAVLSSIPYDPIFYAIFALTFVPNLSVEVRRLHDIGKTGWFAYILSVALIGVMVFTTMIEPLITNNTLSQWLAVVYLVFLVSFIVATIWMLVLCARPSKLTNNKYRKQ